MQNIRTQLSLERPMEIRLWPVQEHRGQHRSVRLDYTYPSAVMLVPLHHQLELLVDLGVFGFGARCEIVLDRVWLRTFWRHGTLMFLLVECLQVSADRFTWPHRPRALNLRMHVNLALTAGLASSNLAFSFANGHLCVLNHSHLAGRVWSYGTVSRDSVHGRMRIWLSVAHTTMTPRDAPSN